MHRSEEPRPILSRSIAKEAAVAAGAVLVFRLAFLLLLPSHAISLDVKGWQRVGAMLMRGENPYSSGLLNWPPVWMVVLYGLTKLASATGLSFVSLLQTLLIAAEAVNATLVVIIAMRFLRVERPRLLVVAGIAANPIFMFLTCQQRNFDALPVMAMLLFVLAMLCYRESDNPVDWLLAAAALGAGILIKTFPLLLAPLLAFRARRLRVRTVLFGAALATVPTAIAMSVVYVLAPADVLNNVIRYRGSAGSFGLTGLMNLAGLPSAINAYARLFPWLAIAAMFAIGRRIHRLEDFDPKSLVLLVAMILTALIAFGPGYVPPYIAWPMPFLVLTFPCFDSKWRQDLGAAFGVALLTFIPEYALLPNLGAFLLTAASSKRVWYLSDTLSDARVATLFQLPLFAAYAWVVMTGCSRLLRSADRSE